MCRNLDDGPVGQKQNKTKPKNQQQKETILKLWTLDFRCELFSTEQILDGFCALAGTGTGTGDEARGKAGSGRRRAGHGGTAAAGGAQRTAGAGAATRQILEDQEGDSQVYF